MLGTLSPKHKDISCTQNKHPSIPILHPFHLHTHLHFFRVLLSTPILAFLFYHCVFNFFVSSFPLLYFLLYQFYFCPAKMLSNQQSTITTTITTTTVSIKQIHPHTRLPTLTLASTLSRHCRVRTWLQRYWLSAEWGVRHHQRLVQLHAARGQGLRQLPEMSEEIRLQLVVVGAS